ncbi:hypothetical protein LNQ03_32645 [Klebsiella pneumoniae subsp. pneumoniae]|nr:hypothetical protein [Klebsiella pneumoniae subsp. pneumoniae]
MPLTELFVARFADEQGIRGRSSLPISVRCLTRYSWPGNVRQLKRVPGLSRTDPAGRI